MSKSKKKTTSKTNIFKKLKKTILDTDVNKLATSKTFFPKMQKGKPEEQLKMSQLLLAKIDYTKGKATPELQKLHAETLFQAALITSKLHAEEADPSLKAYKFKGALELLYKANILVQKNDLGLTIDPEKEIRELIESYKSDEIQGSDKQALEFAKASLKHQGKELPQNHPSILSALLTAARTGNEVSDGSAKLEALNYAKSAYNMAINLGDVNSSVAALRLEAEIYRFYGDETLATSLFGLAKSLKPTEGKQNQEDASRPHEQIMKHNQTSPETLTIKLQIQQTVLDPIQRAAAKGKWVDKHIQGNFGVSGYLGNYLKTQLGTLNSEENMKIALKLCFEAINLGIMSVKEPNPLCAAIFAQKYPEIVEQTLKENPEYLVDGFIVRTSTKEAHPYTESILGKKVSTNGDGYNKYLEKAIIPFIINRLQGPVLDQITKIISSGTWDEEVKSTLLTLLSERYLTTSSALYNSYLGHNLSTEKDMFNIVRMLAFKTLVEAITESGSTNYAPVSAFVQAYPELIVRIAKDHPEYFKQNNTILLICTKNQEEFDFCNEARSKATQYKQQAEKYIERANKLLEKSTENLKAIEVLKAEITDSTQSATITTTQELTTIALGILNSNVKNTQDKSTEIHILAETLDKIIFTASKEELDTIVKKMETALSRAKTSYEQAVKASESVTEDRESIEQMVDGSISLRPASAEEVLDGPPASPLEEDETPLAGEGASVSGD